METKIISADNQVSLERYFHTVLMLNRQGEEFPVDFDDVWPLLYQKKHNAEVEFKKGPFYEDTDYLVFLQKQENPTGGRSTKKIMLSVKCFEYFIARKIPAVFAVYRNVFHHYMNSQSINPETNHYLKYTDPVNQKSLSKQTSAQINKTTGNFSEHFDKIHIMVCDRRGRAIKEQYRERHKSARQVLRENESYNAAAESVIDDLYLAGNSLDRIENTGIHKELPSVFRKMKEMGIDITKPRQLTA